MIDGNLKDFLDGLYYGKEMLIEHNKIRYLVQGWFKNNLYHLEMWNYTNPNKYKWSCDFPTQEECINEFLKTKHWNEKTFYEIEKDIKWTENWDL